MDYCHGLCINRIENGVIPMDAPPYTLMRIAGHKRILFRSVCDTMSLPDQLENKAFRPDRIIPRDPVTDLLKVLQRLR